ncbi:unnamed protein product [Brassica rapa subsp. narinosa]
MEPNVIKLLNPKIQKSRDVSEIENHGPVVVRRVEFESDDEPVEVRFVYENLKMFCQACGSLKHHKAQCPFPRAN